MARLNSLLNLFIAVPVIIILIGDLLAKHRNDGKQFSFFNCILLSDAIMLLCNAAGWHILSEYHPVKGEVMWYLWCTAGGAGDLFYFLMLGAFVLYVTEYISERRKVSMILPYVSAAICLLQGVLWFTSAFTGIVYSYKGEMVEPGPLYILGQAGGYFVAVMVVAMVIIYRDALTAFESLSIICFVMMPLCGVILRRWLDDVALLPILISFTAIMIHSFIHAQRDILIQKQETELERVRMEVMISRIQPHFISNTLNSIYSLCDVSTERAKEAIALFSDYLRKNLNRIKDNRLISFEEEFKHVEDYLSIEKMRFDDNLDIVYDIEDTGFTLPPLSLVTIVENAVRHGIEKKVGGGQVIITTRRTEEGHVLKVRDTGAGIQDKGQGAKEVQHTGIENTAYRIEHLCRGSLTMHSEPGEGTEVTIIIPGEI